MLLGIRRTRRDVRAPRSRSRSVSPASRSWHPDVSVSPTEEVDDSLYARLAPKSYMLVPLAARGRALGSLTLLSTREGRHYGNADLAFAETLAGRCALAIDNARLHAVAERTLTLLDSVFATAPVGLAFVDHDLRFVRVNDTMERLPRAHRASSRTLPARARQRRVGPRPAAQRRRPALERLVHAGARAGGDVVGVSAVVLDVTERQRLLDSEREGRARGGLPGARRACCWTRRSTTSATLALGGRHRGPRGRRLVRGQRARRRRRAAAGRRRPHRPRAAAVGRGAPAPLPARRQPGDRLDAGRARRRDRVRARDHRGDARRRHPRPGAARARAQARPALGHHRPAARPHADVRDDHARQRRARAGCSTQADVQLAEELARRAATAIDNARLYTERTHIAHTLQARLLPARLPEIPGAVLAARYRAAGELNEVGGDFYDVFPRASASGRWWSATSRARARRRRPSPHSPATRCAPARSTTARRRRRCGGSTWRCAPTTTARSSPPPRWPTCRPRATAGSRSASSLAGHPPRDGRPQRRDGRAPGRTATCSRSATTRVPRDPAPARPGRRAAALHRRRHRGRRRATGRSASTASPSCSARSRASRRRRSSTRSRRRWSTPTRASRATTSRCSRSGWPRA